MAIHDPKNTVSRIIDPNMSPDAMAARALASQQQVENHPIFKAMKTQNEKMREDMLMLANQMRSLTTRFHAILDYFTKCGLMLTQEIDEKGMPVGEPHSPAESSTMIWENLVETGLTTMPTYGIEPFLAEHIRLGEFIVQVNQAQLARAVEMPEVIKQCREFNAEESRLVQIRGDAFGLAEYLNTNPDEMTEEELDALGVEFGLAKQEELKEELIAEE